MEAREPQRPTIGRIVHYTNLGDAQGKYPPEVQAAIVTGLCGPNTGLPGRAHLHIFYKSGAFDMEADFTTEPAGSELARGRWSWPARA